MRRRPVHAMNSGFFTCNNLKGDYPALLNDVRLGTPTAVFGVSDSQKYLTAGLFGGTVLYIAPDPISAEKAYAAMRTLSGRKCAYLPPKDDVLLYKDAVSRDVLFRRMAALHAISHGAEIIVCDVESAIQLVPREVPSVTLNRGDETDFSSLPANLTAMGYTREYAAESAGTFAVRGDILDVWPVGADMPVRVDFFGDLVERIRPYDAAGGEKLDDIGRAELIAASDALIAEGDLPVVRAALSAGLRKCASGRAYERSRAIADEIEGRLSAGAPFAGASFLMPLLSSSCTLFDLLPADCLVVLDECKSISDRLSALCREHEERFRSLNEGGEVFDFCAAQFIGEDRFVARVESFRDLALQTFTSSTQFFRPLKTYNLHSTPTPSYLNSAPALISDIKNWRAGGYRVLVFTGSVHRLEKLADALDGEYIAVDRLPDSLDAMRGVCLSSEELAKGFVLHEAKLAIVGSGDIYTKAVQRRVRRRRGDLFAAPEVGDYAVHEKHGIGRITGTKKIETTDGIKEYIAIEYRGGDVLYVPVEQMDILSKYSGEGSPALSRIGGAEFERVKERVRQSIKKLAFDLKELYAERSRRVGHRFPEHAAMMEEFENAFEYEETADQLASIDEIKRDMCSDKVMDRLLCGDVGYGKTEVALRAIYLCVLGGKQAAFMCPSTILSEQHYRTALRRFNDFGVRVEKLNRFLTPAEQQKVLGRLAAGDVDVVIGTHRLLSDDVRFCDLGLLVLDEEQRFGVEHKEKIKHIKNDVDCLTMTATPIPRTLHMSLAGIRDISTITTPPQKRLPVQTYVVEETPALIRDAVLREIARGGQVFVLYNRVETISSFAGKLCELVPEANVTYAHGRMDKNTLESNVFAFYRGEKNVLVTTTIIENGIDLPNANTIIVIDSDRLGISQLYQLRGRVGRGARLASAYFTFRPDKVMTSEATERLKAIMQFTELGSGFKIAMRDLEIRGAGNVLGAEQHGHMDKVGYELYSKLLKEELTGENVFSAELDVKATAYIPESYIESSAGRLDAYKQIAEIRTVGDYKRVLRSVEENYGPMPDCVFNLLIIAVLKAYAAKFNVKKISVNSAGGSLELPSLNALSDGRLSGALQKYAGKVTLSMARVPSIQFKPSSTPVKTMLGMTNFLKFAASFTQNQ